MRCVFSLRQLIFRRNLYPSDVLVENMEQPMVLLDIRPEKVVVGEWDFFWEVLHPLVKMLSFFFKLFLCAELKHACWSKDTGFAWVNAVLRLVDCFAVDSGASSVCATRIRFCENQFVLSDSIIAVIDGAEVCLDPSKPDVDFTVTMTHGQLGLDCRRDYMLKSQNTAEVVQLLRDTERGTHPYRDIEARIAGLTSCTVFTSLLGTVHNVVFEKRDQAFVFLRARLDFQACLDGLVALVQVR